MSTKRGFASMTPSRRKEIASLGGRTAHKLGRAHRFTSAEAREAGRRSADVKRAKQETAK